MPFNSIEFAIFLPIVFALYWGIFRKNLRLQNIFLLIASYVFYGWWDWRFLSLVIFSSAVDFLVGSGLGKYHKPLTRKLLLLTSLFVNIGFLAFFKYYDFFAESFAEAFTLLGQPIDVARLDGSKETIAHADFRKLLLSLVLRADRRPEVNHSEDQ